MGKYVWAILIILGLIALLRRATEVNMLFGTLASNSLKGMALIRGDEKVMGVTG